MTNLESIVDFMEVYTPHLVEPWLLAKSIKSVNHILDRVFSETPNENNLDKHDAWNKIVDYLIFRDSVGDNNEILNN